MRTANRFVRRLVRNTYRNNPTVLAEWVVASHIEAGKAHHAEKPAPAPPTPPPA